MDTITSKRRWLRRIVIAAASVGLCLGVAIVGVLQARPPLIKNYDLCVAYGFPISGTSPKVCTASGSIFRGPLAVATPSAPVDVPFQTISALSRSGNYPEKNDIFTTRVDWKTFWNKRHEGDNSNPYLPSIDFAQKVVVAISEGPFHSKAVGIQILSVKSSPQETVVSASMNKPGATCSSEPSISNPISIIAFDIPASPIRFDIKIRSQQCTAENN